MKEERIGEAVAQDQPRSGRVVFTVDRRTVLMYHYHDKLFKPYFFPLVGPTNKNLTQDIPADHIHHRSLWYAHHSVNGVDFYYERGPEGRIVHQRFVSLVSEGSRVGFKSENCWVAPTGEAVLWDVREAWLTPLAAREWYLDLAITFEAGSGDVVFSDTKEAGFPLVRVADLLDALDGGTIVASTGGRGERETFGTRAAWVDYSGPMGTHNVPDGSVQGIALFDHPSNEGHPPQIFTRDYGPFSLREGFMFTGGRTLKKGESLTIRTRIYAHRGNAEAARLHERFNEYAKETLDS